MAQVNTNNSTSMSVDSGSQKLQWFYWPRHWLRFQEQDETNPRAWMTVDPPNGGKAAVLKAIRTAKNL